MHELYDQGYIETRNDIVDMLEQPLLLQKRVRHIYKHIEGLSIPSVFLLLSLSFCVAVFRLNALEPAM